MSYLKSRILSVWEDTKKAKSELESFLTLREYFKSPSADLLIKSDPQIAEIKLVVEAYNEALHLYRQGLAISYNAKDLEDKNPQAEAEIARLYEEAEQKLTEALQVLSEVGLVKGALYFAIISALSNIPVEAKR